MTKFEEWADDCDETDEKYYAIPVGSVARGVARDAWNAALDEAVRVCEERSRNLEPGNTNHSESGCYECGAEEEADYLAHAILALKEE